MKKSITISFFVSLSILGQLSNEKYDQYFQQLNCCMQVFVEEFKTWSPEEKKCFKFSTEDTYTVDKTKIPDWNWKYYGEGLESWLVTFLMSNKKQYPAFVALIKHHQQTSDNNKVL